MYGWEFPPHNSGGLGTACYGLSTALTRCQVGVTFVLPRPQESDSSDLLFRYVGGGTLDVRPFPALIDGYMTARSYQEALTAAGGSLYGQNLLEEVRRYAQESGRIARESAHDVIHMHDWLSFGAGLEAKAQSGRPLVAHVHATEFDRTGGQGMNEQVLELERQGVHGADHVIAVSEYTKQVLIHHYDLSPERISVVHNGVGPVPRSTGPVPLVALKRQGCKIILFLGRITLQKGPDYFLEAAAKVLRYEPQARFVMAGSGDLLPAMMQKAAALGLGSHVFFPGFVRGPELAALYRSADLFVMPSVSEPFGIAPLEALRAGVPVLLSKQSGVSEVVPNALKVDFWDTDEMANQIVAALRYRPLRRELLAAGRRDAKGQRWSTAAARCVEIYQSLLGARQMMAAS